MWIKYGHSGNIFIRITFRWFMWCLYHPQTYDLTQIRLSCGGLWDDKTFKVSYVLMYCTGSKDNTIELIHYSWYSSDVIGILDDTWTIVAYLRAWLWQDQPMFPGVNISGFLPRLRFFNHPYPRSHPKSLGLDTGSSGTHGGAFDSKAKAWRPLATGRAQRTYIIKLRETTYLIDLFGIFI